MPFRKIENAVSEFYHSILPIVFQQNIPPEPFSDCSNCPMIAEKGEDPGLDLNRPFGYETKCCTFTPRIPNYMVGGILSDTDPSLIEGKQRIVKKIQSREGIIPNGVYPTKEYNDYFIANSPLEFGRSKSLLCPYFIQDKYNCTIWKYREAICSFWYCKHIAAECGSDFWNSMVDYLKFIQDSFIEIAAKECGLQLVDLYGTGKCLNSQYSEIWGKWLGREEEYYAKCFEIVNNLSASQIKKIISSAQGWENNVEHNLNKLVHLPEFLIANRNVLKNHTEDYYQIELSSYIKSTDKSIAWSFQIPRFVIDYFSGHTQTEEVIRMVDENHFTKLENEILIALYRHDILREQTK
jgi:hypothetical protein